MNFKLLFSNVLVLLILVTGLLINSCASTEKADKPGKTDTEDYYTVLERSMIGDYNKYTYEFWNQNETGKASMKLREDGTYDITWSGIFNMLARNGVRPGQDVTSVTYAVDNYYVNSGVSYLCVYGWAYDKGTNENLVEFYILDNWKNYRPPGNDGTYKGTIEVDGASYDIYTSMRVNQPSIKGNTTFTQYWSVRQDGLQRTSGTIDVKAHFDAWAELGMEFGDTMYEVSFCVEGYGGNSGGSGHANLSELSFNTK